MISVPKTKIKTTWNKITYKGVTTRKSNNILITKPHCAAKDSPQMIRTWNNKINIDSKKIEDSQYSISSWVVGWMMFLCDLESWTAAARDGCGRRNAPNPTHTHPPWDTRVEDLIRGNLIMRCDDRETLCVCVIKGNKILLIKEKNWVLPYL